MACIDPFLQLLASDGGADEADEAPMVIAEAAVACERCSLSTFEVSRAKQAAEK